VDDRKSDHDARRNADTKVFRNAVDQCAEVGFEMIIYTFGSGLNMENEEPSYIAKVTPMEYAHSKGIEVGAYSLSAAVGSTTQTTSSTRRLASPAELSLGNAPCFGSAWGTNYFRKLTNFGPDRASISLSRTGPYPGDICASTNHPGHQ
jgi:hypothetical protein